MKFGVAKLDHTAARLAALRQQAERMPQWEADAVSPSLDVANALIEEADRVGRARYLPDRVGEELSAAHAVAVDGLRDVYAGIVDAVAAEVERVTDHWDGVAATRQRENRRLGDVIDLDALVNADDAQTVLGMVGTAAAFGLRREATQVALRTVRVRAAAEQRRNRINGPWFAAMCALTAANPAPAARHDVAGAVESRGVVLRSFVQAVADAIGLGVSLAREVAKPEPPKPEDTETPRPTLTFGRYWER